MDWLRRRLVELKRKNPAKTGAAFARALGVHKTRVYEMQRGDRRIQPDEISDAARFLELPESDLLALIEGRKVPPRADHKSVNSTDDSRDTVAPPLPALVLWKSSRTNAGRFGGFMLSETKVGEVARPELLRYADKAFSFTVADDDNRPAYRIRDIVLVNPDETVREGDDCVFTHNPTPPGCETLVGELIRETASEWVIRQYGKKGEQHLPKAAFPKAWLIVGRYNRR